MARVYSKTKATYGKPYHCRRCGKEITPGQRYYEWKNRRGRSSITSRIHADHGRPMPSELSSRKTAQIEDLLPGAAEEIGNWSPDDGEIDTADVLAALEPVADAADSVADEYEESADNMPENLQNGSQGEAMRDVAQRLHDWADELRDWTPEQDEPELPDREEFGTDEAGEEAFDEATSQAWDEWRDGVRSDAQSKLDEMPEYEG